MGGQTRKGLLAGASHSHKQRVAAGVGHDAADAAHVLHSILKEDEVHNSIGFVVLCVCV